MQKKEKKFYLVFRKILISIKGRDLGFANTAEPEDLLKNPATIDTGKATKGRSNKNNSSI